MTTVGEALREATARLGTDWARDEAEMLMAHALGCSRSAMLLGRMRDPAPEAFAAMVARRLAHEPVAYIAGEAEFFGRRFGVRPGILIPRGDSEAVVLAALEAFTAPRRVLDMGTGSGALLLTVLAERSEATGVGIDASPVAVGVTQGNAETLGVADRCTVHLRDWTRGGWADDLGAFDLVLCNPPYVEDDADLDASVRDFEPGSALFAGPEGLDDYRTIVPQLPALLAPGGAAVLEIGWRQAAAVTAMAQAAGFDVALRHDLAGRDRVLVLTQKGLAKPG